MTGVSCAPPPRTGWLGQRCAGRSLGGGGRPSAWGGEAAERMGGRGSARSRSRTAGSGGRAGLLPAATGRVADGARPMKTTGHVKTESTELSLTPFGLENIDPRSPKLLTIKFTGVPFRLPSLVTLALIEAEIAGRGRICPPPPFQGA